MIPSIITFQNFLDRYNKFVYNRAYVVMKKWALFNKDVAWKMVKIFQSDFLKQIYYNFSLSSAYINQGQNN